MITSPANSDAVALTLNARQEHCSLAEIDTNCDIRAVAFAANGQNLVSGGTEGVRVWRVEDGKQVASISEVRYVRCLTVSKDGRWIAVGTWKEVVVWDAETYERVFTHEDATAYFNGVDFSPDSTRFVTGSLDGIALIWDVATRQRVVGPLVHEDVVIAAKYSPDGTRIATATPKFVRVYDSNDGRLLVDVPIVQVSWYNTGLVWSNQHLLAVSDSTIKQIDASTGSKTSEWQVPDSNESSCIALPPHGEYIAYATNRAVTVWDLSTRSQLVGPIQYPQDIRSIVHSPDGRFLVIAGDHGKVTFSSLSPVNDSIPLPRLHPTFQEPDLQIEGAALDAWQHDRLENAEALLTATISTSPESIYHVLASRALIRTRLRDWDAALCDAEQSMKIKPSVIGCIAKSMALVGMGEKYDGYRTCDIAFERFHSTHVSTILLIKAIIVFIAGDHDHAISRLDDLIDTVHFNSICYAVQGYMYFLLGSSHMDRRNYELAIQYFERARARTRYHKSRTLSVISLISGWKFDDLDIMIQRHLCEALYAAGCTKEAGESLLKIVCTDDDEAHVSGPIATWAYNFLQRCLSTPGSTLDPVSKVHDDVGLHPQSPTPLLREWTKLKLTSCSWKDALSAAVGFTTPKSTVYQSICEQLETLEQITDATECFHQMMHTLGWENKPPAKQVEWIPDFEYRISKKLECRGDAAVDAGRLDEAISEYSAALSLHPASPQDILIKRSKTYITRGLWKGALNDANEVIELDPSSPWGYERKHSALHKAGNYDDAIDAFETMLAKMAHSPDLKIRERHQDYVDPAKTRAAICRTVQDAIRDTPRVLINTVSGHLLNKSKQASSFEALPVFKEMISSMTTTINYARIEREVTQYYRYATFSHKWEESEPLYDRVIHIVVYDLDKSLTHDKLRMFCKIVRDAGFDWAWSDTCCINKADHFVLQEALVAMFKWYEGSAVTIVFLRDVRSPAQRGDLVRSIWNTRAWTFQEYHASKVVQFYTEDWKPYMNLDIYNHKESPEIISEMEEATGVSAQTLMALRPGLDDIREKLCLASRRETTLIEDAAYSLLGMFSASLPIVYGEGDGALGRLLSQLITSSGDSGILAWTGRSGTFNSCLPTNIAVFSELASTHIPPATNDAEMETIIAKLHASSLNFAQAQKLYDRLSELSVPMFVGKRMKLPCITFKLGPLSASRSKSERVFRAQTTGLGVVEIRTKEDLSRLDSLYLAHPWIDYLLHRHPVGSGTDTARDGSTEDLRSTVCEVSPSSGPANIALMSRQVRTLRLGARLSLSFGGWSAPHPRDAMSLLPPSSISGADKRTRVLQFVARLRRPFGALLFTPTRRNVAEYRRVASESSITVRVQEDASLSVLLENARMLDVL